MGYLVFNLGANEELLSHLRSSQRSALSRTWRQNKGAQTLNRYSGWGRRTRRGQAVQRLTKGFAVKNTPGRKSLPLAIWKSPLLDMKRYSRTGSALFDGIQPRRLLGRAV